MRAVQGGTQTLDAFVARVGAQLAELVADGRALRRIAIPPRPTLAPKPAGPNTPNPGKSGVQRHVPKSRKERTSC
jgi:hypothetical protein